MDRQQFTSLLAFLRAVPDPRKPKGKRYQWVPLLVIVCTALRGFRAGCVCISGRRCNLKKPSLFQCGYLTMWPLRGIM